LLAFVDSNADPERRVDGALLIGAFMRDVSLIRQVFVKVDGDDDGI
jgi:hypothetical protein